MADELKTPLAQQAQQNADELVNLGLITEQTAALLSPSPAQQSIPDPAPAETDQENRQQVEVPLESKQEESELGAEIQPASLDNEQTSQLSQAQTNVATTTPSNEEVQQATNTLQQDTEQKIRQQQATDLEDIAIQSSLQKEQLKSQIAQSEAESLAAQETALENQVEADAISLQISKEQEDLRNLTLKDSFDGDEAPISKLRSTMAIILGAIGAGLTGGPNLGLQAVNRVMDQHFNNKKLAMKERLARKQHIFNLLKLDVDRQSQATDNEIKQARLQQLRDQLEQGRLSALQQRMQIADRDALLRKVQGKKISDEEEALLIQSLSKEDRKRYIPGFGLAKDAEVAKNVSKQLDFGQQALSQVDKIRELLGEFGTREVFNRGAVAAEESARKNLQIQLKELFNLGVLNGPDLVLLEQFTGDDFFGFTTTDANKFAKLKSVEDYIRNRVNASLSTAGLPKLGKSKLDSFVEHAMSKGLSRQKSVERYQKLIENGQLK